MRPLKPVLTIAILFVGLVAGADAQPLAKRHQIGLRLGMWSQTTDIRTEVGIGTVSTSVGGDGFMGGLAYTNWLQESLALEIRIGAMAAEVKTVENWLTVSTKTTAVGELLFGVKYYFPRSTYGNSVRPFVGASAATFIGKQEETTVGLYVVTESRTESAFGGQFAAGIDFVLSRHFMMGASVGYNLMSDFDEPIGGSKNYGGPEFTMGIGYLFGRGVS